MNRHPQAWNRLNPEENQGQGFRFQRGPSSQQCLKTPGLGELGQRLRQGVGLRLICLLEGWISVCALDRLQNKYLRLENRKSTIHTKCSLQGSCCVKTQARTQLGSPSSPADPDKGCAMVSYFIISFYFSLLLLILLLFAFAVVTIIGKVPFSLPDMGFLSLRFHSEAEQS